MKRILGFAVLGLLAFAPLMRAQPAPTSAAAVASRQEAEENYNSLKGRVDDLVEAQSDLRKQLQAMKRDIEDLRSQVGKPTGNYASQEDLKRLADAIQELDKKREADKELILKEMEKLAKVVSAPVPHVPKNTTISTDPGPTVPAGDQNGLYYTVKKDDSISLIAQGYREQGIKVSTKQIMDANPNLNADKLRVGMKIFIPTPKSSK